MSSKKDIIEKKLIWYRHVQRLTNEIRKDNSLDIIRKQKWRKTKKIVDIR